MTKPKLADTLLRIAVNHNTKREELHAKSGLTREQREQKALIAEKKALAKRLWTEIKKDIREKAKKGWFFSNYKDRSEDVLYLVKEMADEAGLKTEITQCMDNDGDDGDGRQWYKTYKLAISWQ